LYRAANKLIKTLYIARTAMLSGNDNTALLNYNEVASLFLDKKKVKVSKQEKSLRGQTNQNTMSKNLAICYNNIACIHTKQKNFQKQYLYYMRSI
jgi:hypothetical protein